MDYLNLHNISNNKISFLQKDKINSKKQENIQIKYLENDVFISKKSKNKNKLLKNLLMATTGLAVATFCTIAIAKVCKLSKIKKDIIKCYDEIFDFINSASSDMNFQKPELKFIKTAPNELTDAFYDISKNRIYISKKALNPRTLCKDISENCMVNVDEIGEDTLFSYLYKSFNKKETDICATYDEYLLDISASLAHELTHAKQFQQMLSAKEIKKEFIIGICKQQKLNPKNKEHIDEIKKTYPFVFQYKPKKSTSLDTTYKIEGGRASLIYSNRSTLDGYLNYEDKSENQKNYLLNPIEITAEIGKENIIRAFSEGKLLTHLKPSDNAIAGTLMALEHNSYVLVKNFDEY